MAETDPSSTPATDAPKKAAEAGAKLGHQATQAAADTAKAGAAAGIDAATKAAETGARLGRQTTQAASMAAGSMASAGQDAARKAAETVSNFTRTAAETNKALFGDITRMFADMRFPTMLPDAGVLMAAHRRNMDVLSQANRLALEGAQAVARRHMEIMQQTMHELTEHVRELASSDTPQHKAARQAELVKQSYERAVTNIRELSDLIQRSNGEAVELLNARFKEAWMRSRGCSRSPARSRFSPGMASSALWFSAGAGLVQAGVPRP